MLHREHCEQRNQIYVPRGLAHELLALSKRVQFLHKCSDYHDGADEYGVAYDHPELNSTWGITSPLLSGKDKGYRPRAKIPQELLPRYV